MKSNELKKTIAKRFDIPLKNIRIRDEHGWLKIYIHESEATKRNFKDFREQGEFETEVEKVILENREVNHFTADDGYNTSMTCILVSFISNFDYV